MTIVVNFFGEPGAGKTTMMAAVFAELKFRGINCEMATEYAKDLVWEERENVMLNQLYISGKQFHRVNRLIGKVDVVVTDSPVLLGIVYNKHGDKESFNKVLAEHFNRFDNINFLVVRGENGYREEGRLQTEEESAELKKKIHHLIHDYTVGCTSVFKSREHVDLVIKMIMNRMGEDE